MCLKINEMIGSPDVIAEIYKTKFVKWKYNTCKRVNGK